MRNRIGKSIVALVLILAMAVMGGCSSSGGGKTQEGKTEGGNTEEETKGSAIKAEIEEQVLAEKDGVKITATGLGSDDNSGIHIDVKTENDTENNYQVWIDHVMVNGYDMTGSMMNDIVPGEMEAQIEIRSAAFKYAEVGEIGEIRLLGLRLMELDEVKAEDEEGEEYTYYEVTGEQYEKPYFEKEEIAIQTSAYDQMKEAAMPEGKELYHENGIQLIEVEADEEDKDKGCCSIFFLKNDSEDQVGFGTKDPSMNDFMLEDAYGLISCDEIMPGSIAAVAFQVDQFMLSYLLGAEDAEIESFEATIVFNRLVDDERGRFPENFAEVPYSWSAE